MRPEADAEAQVVAKYFPTLGAQAGEGPARRRGRVRDASYKPAPVGGGGTGRDGLPGAQRLMRALVLSGGEGSRLRPLTHTSAKQLIPVAGTPILFHALEAIADAGITEVGIVVGPDRRGGAQRPSATDRDGACEVTYIPQDAPLGLAHAVLTARDVRRRASRS